MARRLEVKYKLEALSGLPCLIVRYPRATPALLRHLAVRAVFVSGNTTNFKHYADEDLAGLRAIFREAHWPTLGLCGGYEMLGQAYGAEVAPMGPLQPGDPVPAPGLAYSPGMRQERGFMRVHVFEAHPLLEGLGPHMVVFQAHNWEVKAPPEGFRALASSELCRVQVMAHDTAPLFGTQFHPEHYDEAHPDGRRLLENFLRMAGILSPQLTG